MLNEPICEKYYHFAIQDGLFFAQAYSQLIVLFAMAVRNAYAWLASKHHFKGKTTESITITLSLFAVNLVIYGLVPLLATADVRPKEERPQLERFFLGMYYDFNAEWF